jgi:hypothetical protein
VGVEIFLHQSDLYSVRKVDAGQVIERVGVIHGGTAAGDLDVPPALKRGEHHKKIGDAGFNTSDISDVSYAFVFIAAPRRSSRPHRD